MYNYTCIVCNCNYWIINFKGKKTTSMLQIKQSHIPFVTIFSFIFIFLFIGVTVNPNAIIVEHQHHFIYLMTRLECASLKFNWIQHGPIQHLHAFEIHPRLHLWPSSDGAINLTVFTIILDSHRASMLTFSFFKTNFQKQIFPSKKTKRFPITQQIKFQDPIIFDLFINTFHFD